MHTVISQAPCSPPSWFSLWLHLLQLSSSLTLLQPHRLPHSSLSLPWDLPCLKWLMCHMPNYLLASFFFSVLSILVIVRLVYSEKLALSVIWKCYLETQTHLFFKCIPHDFLDNFLSCDPFSAFILLNYLYVTLLTAPFYLKVSSGFSSKALVPVNISYLHECFSASFTGSSFSAPSALGTLLSSVLCSLYISNPGNLILLVTQICSYTLCAPKLSLDFTSELYSQLPTSQLCW